MGTGQRIRGIARLGAVLALAASVGVLGQSGAGAAARVAPAPLGAAGDTAPGLLPAPPPSDPTPVTQVVGTVQGVLGSPSGPGSDPGPTAGSGTGSQPGTQTATGRGTSSSAPGANTSAARVGAAPAADDDTVAGADVTVRGLLGACVRLTSAGVPARATIVVLDQNLLDQLRAVGLPVDRLVVPCPAGAAVGTAGGSTGGTTSAAATADPSGNAAGAETSGLLAFTGGDLAPTLLLAGGLIALGIAFLRKAQGLVDDRVFRAGEVLG